MSSKRQGRSPVSVLLQTVRYWASSREILFSDLMAFFLTHFAQSMAKLLQARAGNLLTLTLWKHLPDTLEKQQHQTPPASTGPGECKRCSWKLSLRNTNLHFTHACSPAAPSNHNLTAELHSEYLLLLDLITPSQHLTLNYLLLTCQKQWFPPSHFSMTKQSKLLLLTIELTFTNNYQKYFKFCRYLIKR